MNQYGRSSFSDFTLSLGNFLLLPISLSFDPYWWHSRTRGGAGGGGFRRPPLPACQIIFAIGRVEKREKKERKGKIRLK